MTLAVAPASQGRLGLPDAAFFRDPLSAAGPCALEQLERDEPLLLLDAPREVSLALRAGLPLVALRVASYAEQRQVPLLLASDVERKRAWCAPAWDAPPATDRPPLRGLGATQRLVDARARLRLPWTADATLRLQLLLGAQASNPVTVRLATPRPAWFDPAVAEFLAANAPPNDPGPPVPMAARFEAGADSPPVPEDVGVVFSLPPRVPPAGPALLTGSFRLPVRAAELAPPADPAKPARALAARRPAARKPTAVLGLTFVLVGERSPGPWLLRLRVPSYDALPPAAELAPDATAAGHFQLDLLKHAATRPAVEQTYFVHAVAGDVVSAPVPLTLARDAS